MNSESYIPMDLSYGKEARTNLMKGIASIAKAVKSTLGPRGETVLLQDPNVPTGMRITKDGYTVARAIDLDDPAQELAVRIMKQASTGTVKGAGDGTTTSIVLAEALIEHGMNVLDKDPTLNRSEVVREMNHLIGAVLNKLSDISTPLREELLRSVARISANNDTTIGDIVADAYIQVGEGGVVTLDRSADEDTFIKTVTGTKLMRGFTSRGFITNPANDTAEYDDAFVLLSDVEIGNIMQIQEAITPIIKMNAPVLIIAPCSDGMVKTLARNKAVNSFKLLNIQPPDFGWRKKELMEDLAVATGATYFAQDSGTDISTLAFKDFGRVRKVQTSSNETILTFYTDEHPRPDKAEEVIEITDDGNVYWQQERSQLIAERKAAIAEAMKNAKKKLDKEFYEERYAMFAGGISVVYVGGETEIERNEKYDRVDDAVCAVRSAIEEGVVTGAGLPLYRLSNKIKVKEDAPKEASAAAEIVAAALKAPATQIFANAGKDIVEEYGKKLDAPADSPDGINLMTGEFTDLIAAGVVDPVKVTRTALKNAASVATTILTTSTTVTLQRADK